MPSSQSQQLHPFVFYTILQFFSLKRNVRSNNSVAIYQNNSSVSTTVGIWCTTSRPWAFRLIQQVNGFHKLDYLHFVWKVSHGPIAKNRGFQYPPQCYPLNPFTCQTKKIWTHVLEINTSINPQKDYFFQDSNFLVNPLHTQGAPTNLIDNGWSQLFQSCSCWTICITTILSSKLLIHPKYSHWFKHKMHCFVTLIKNSRRLPKTNTNSLAQYPQKKNPQK